MPSKSPAQARLMAAAAHTPGGYGGVPQSVGREFNKADTGTGMIRPKRKKAAPSKENESAAAEVTKRLAARDKKGK